MARFVLAVRQACPGVPVGVTTGAWASPDPAARVRSVRSWTALPDFASVNWHEEGADDVAAALIDRGIGVEAGIWPGEGLARWQASPWRGSCLRALVELADVPDEDAAAWVARQATPLVDGVHRLEPELPVLLHGAEGSTWAAVDLAARLGLDTRVGLEDTTRLPGGATAAGNAQLVEAALTRVAEDPVEQSARGRSRQQRLSARHAAAACRGQAARRRCALCPGERSRRRRSCALTATTTVDRDIRTAPTLMGRTKPTGASTPAASGTETRL